MKKLLIILSLIMTPAIFLSNANFNHQTTIKTNNYNNQLENKNHNSQITTTIHKSLSTVNDETKCYLNDYISDANLISRIQVWLSNIVHSDNIGVFIYEDDINSVTDLDLSNANITSFTGLQCFPNLTSLDISNNSKFIHLGDLQRILDKLIMFNIYGNYISDIGKLIFFTSLKDLYVSYLKMNEEIKFSWVTLFFTLSLIPNLSNLDLSFNTNVADVADLYNLPNLTELILRGDGISDSDVDVLSNLRNLTQLDLSDNYIYDINGLSNLTNLTWLNLDSNRISNLTPLSNLTSLSFIDLKSNCIPNNDTTWLPLRTLPNYDSSWDNQDVRKSQRNCLTNK